MRGMRIWLAALGSAAVLGSAGACARPNEAAGQIAPATTADLKVINDNFYDMDVYAVLGGIATRVGTVTGHSTDTFTLAPTYLQRDLQIVGVPVGASGRASSGTILVTPGDEVDFRIGTVLTNSTIFIR